MNINWDVTLHNLIKDIYDEERNAPDGVRILDVEDKQIQCVLLVLHAAIQGKTSLLELSEMCINFDKGIKTVPLIETMRRPKVWTPKKF